MCEWTNVHRAKSPAQLGAPALAQETSTFDFLAALHPAQLVEILVVEKIGLCLQSGGMPAGA